MENGYRGPLFDPGEVSKQGAEKAMEEKFRRFDPDVYFKTFNHLHAYTRNQTYSEPYFLN